MQPDTSRFLSHWKAAAAATACAAIAAGTGYLLLRSRRRPVRRAPGPKGYPLVGHAPYLMVPGFHRLLTNWANEYGGIYRISLGGDTYIISDAQIANVIMMSRGEGRFLKAPQVYEPSFELSFGSPSIFNDVEEGEYYTTWRRAAITCFSNENLKVVFPDIRRCALALADKWDKLLPLGKPLELEEWTQRAFLDIVLSAGFGIEGTAIRQGPDEFLHATHDAMAVAHKKMSNPFLNPYYKLFPFTRAARESKRIMEHFRAQFTGWLELFRARGTPPPEDKRMWAQVMRVRNPQTGLPYPDNVTTGQLATLLVAGYDTSSWTATWVLYDIARSPEVQQRIKQELAQAGLLQVKGQPMQRPIDWADLHLPYLNAAVKESQRLHPVGGTGTVRVAPRDMTLGGYDVKKGDKLWAPLHTIHTSNVNFTEPTKFDPERWLRPAASTLGPKGDSPAEQASDKPACPTHSNATYKGHSKATTSWLAFSAGPRNCVGMNFAYVTLRVVLLAVLSRFWLELDPSVGSHEEVEAEQVMALVMASGRPLKVLLHHHDAPE